MAPGRALGYAAASSDDPELRKRLAGSAAAIGAWCDASVRWELTTVVHDTLRPQGRAGNRPALDYALERIAGGDADAIVLARLRDLTDSVAELGGLLRRLHDAGGSLVALDFRIDTSTEAGMRAARALIEVGDWERARILEQSRPGLAAARAKRRFAEETAAQDAAA